MDRNSKQKKQQNNTHPFSRYRLALKVILAGITAFVLVNILFLFYRNIPNSFASKTGAADRTQTPHFLYSKMTAGWAYGKTFNQTMAVVSGVISSGAGGEPGRYGTAPGAFCTALEGVGTGRRNTLWDSLQFYCFKNLGIQKERA
jgi:hypothetical protein